MLVVRLGSFLLFTTADVYQTGYPKRQYYPGALLVGP